jgi:hypothetical protein
MHLPPRCPELNPVENVWQIMRDNWLSNRIYQSYDDIVEHCCFAWNRLVDQPCRILSIGLRKWAHGSWPMRVGMSPPLTRHRRPSGSYDSATLFLPLAVSSRFSAS